MENNDYFTFIEEPNEKKEEIKEEQENSFVSGLPDWDLEPPYETIKRGDSK